MAEEYENKDNTEQEGKKDSKVGSVINSAKEQADRLEAANKVQEELILRQEELYVKQQLGGDSTAGQSEKPKTEEQRKSKQAEDFFGGTALGDAIKTVNG